MPSPRKKKAPASSKVLAARERALIWIAWSASMAQEHAQLEQVLPLSTAAPDFKLARAIYTILPTEAGLAALAMIDEAWGWGSNVSALRQEALEAPSGQADRLASLMMGFSQAPWRRWACASAHPGALFDALDALGHREPAIASLGAASLPCLMGFSGLPCHTWLRSASERSSAGAFAASSHGREYCTLFQDLLPLAPDAFPNLPPRPGYAPDFSRACDAMDMASTQPGQELVFAALGLAQREARPAPREPLAAAASTPFFRRLLGSSAAGLPKTLDHDWPLLRALFAHRGPGNDSPRKFIELGASLTDVAQGLELWEHAVQPECETGSEGWYAPIDDELLGLLCDNLDALEPRGLIASWGRAGGDKAWSKAVTLTDFYDLALDPGRARRARETLAPWQVKMEARQLALATPGAPSRPHKAL